MQGVIVVSLAALALCSSWALPADVHNFQVAQKDRPAVRLQKYAFTNCLPQDKEIMPIASLVFTPDPISFPGPLNVAFQLAVKSDVDAPLKGKVYLGKKIGDTWVKIPCIGNIGSCTYDDVCQLLSGIGQCPDPFVAAGVPCQCPFKKGNYKMPGASFDVEVSVLPTGDYHLQGNLTYNDAVVGCYDIMATFE